MQSASERQRFNYTFLKLHKKKKSPRCCFVMTSQLLRYQKNFLLRLMQYSWPQNNLSEFTGNLKGGESTKVSGMVI